MSIKKYLIATAGSVTAAGGALLAPTAGSAADLAIKTSPPPPPPPPPAAAPSWTGLYFGVNAGGAWQSAQTQGNYGASINGIGAHIPVSNSLTRAGFIGGGQVGYNWQSGSLVYGVEADISGLTGKLSTSQPQVIGKGTINTSNRIDWLATFRGRFGFVVGGDTMLYTTGGLAVGGVHNSFGYNSTSWTDNSTRTGWVAGLGAEHMISQNWAVRIEALYADLGSKTVHSNTCPSGCKTTRFANQVGLVRLGLDYKY